ncbi:hypothetical protein KR222_006141, partial [Zaprionus bogoriensis]
VKTNVQQKFGEIRAALHMREKLLLRQLEVIANATQQPQAAPVQAQGKEEAAENCPLRFVVQQEEEQLLLAIRSFGQFQLDSSLQLALHRTRDNISAGLRNEDYIEPMDDHETMYKCLETHRDRDRDNNNAYYELHDEPQPEAIVVDFSRSKSLLEDNAKRSIINITLQEAKDLIRRAKIKRETYVPPLNLEELDDELESSIADAVSSLGRSCSDKPTSKPKTSRKPRFKPKITINNCNGTINLRNIASLTINCASEDAVSAELPLTAPATAAAAASNSSNSSSSSSDSISSSSPGSSSNDSSNVCSRAQSKKQKSSKRAEEPAKASKESSMETTPTQPTSTETHDVTCDFYNRLLNEIKKSLIEKPTRKYELPAEATVAATKTTTAAVAPDSSCDAVSSTRSEANESTLSSHLQPGRRLVLKNFENLKIILEANSGDEDSFHPVQIEQWLAEIISETDLEPMQNTDILEHSRINNSTSN